MDSSESPMDEGVVVWTGDMELRSPQFRGGGMTIGGRRGMQMDGGEGEAPRRYEIQFGMTR